MHFCEIGLAMITCKYLYCWQNDNRPGKKSLWLKTWIVSSVLKCWLTETTILQCRSQMPPDKLFNHVMLRHSHEPGRGCQRRLRFKHAGIETAHLTSTSQVWWTEERLTSSCWHTVRVRPSIQAWGTSRGRFRLFLICDCVEIN